MACTAGGIPGAPLAHQEHVWQTFAGARTLRRHLGDTDRPLAAALARPSFWYHAQLCRRTYVRPRTPATAACKRTRSWQAHMQLAACRNTEAGQARRCCACERRACSTSSVSMRPLAAGPAGSGGRSFRSSSPVPWSRRSGKCTAKRMYRLPFSYGRPCTGMPSSATHIHASGLMTSPTGCTTCAAAAALRRGRRRARADPRRATRAYAPAWRRAAAGGGVAVESLVCHSRNEPCSTQPPCDKSEQVACSDAWGWPSRHSPASPHTPGGTRHKLGSAGSRARGAHLQHAVVEVHDVKRAPAQRVRQPDVLRAPGHRSEYAMHCTQPRRSHSVQVHAGCQTFQLGTRAPRCHRKSKAQTCT